jgi:hypothetical protein
VRFQTIGLPETMRSGKNREAGCKPAGASGGRNKKNRQLLKLPVSGMKSITLLGK